MPLEQNGELALAMCGEISYGPARSDVPRNIGVIRLCGVCAPSAGDIRRARTPAQRYISTSRSVHLLLFSPSSSASPTSSASSSVSTFFFTFFSSSVNS